MFQVSRMAFEPISDDRGLRLALQSLATHQTIRAHALLQRAEELSSAGVHG